MNIEGHSARVTGVGSGLGEAVALKLARQGARVRNGRLNGEVIRFGGALRMAPR